MAQHRTIRRPRRNTSALDKLNPAESPQDRLNTAAPNATRCAWTGCREPLHDNPSRYGVLCRTHALDVATAVLQHQIDQQQIYNLLTQISSDKAVRLAAWRGEAERHEAEKATLRGDRDGFVYYLRVGERIKVGYSVDVKRRMRAYPPGSQLLAVEPGDRALERRRHQQFAGSRTDGREWFRPTPDLLELVDEIVATYGEPKRFAHHYRRNETPVRPRRTA